MQTFINNSANTLKTKRHNMKSKARAISKQLHLKKMIAVKQTIAEMVNPAKITNCDPPPKHKHIIIKLIRNLQRKNLFIISPNVKNDVVTNSYVQTYRKMHEKINTNIHQYMLKFNIE